MKKLALNSIILLVVMILPSLVMSQPAPPDDPNDTFVPLDGGLAILLGAAAAYGSHKIKERRKGKKV
jgi:hypothetical protein